MKIKCPNCESVIESKYRHDYVTCKCGKTSVDGGKDYCKVNFDQRIGYMISQKNKWVQQIKAPNIFKRFVNKITKILEYTK